MRKKLAGKGWPGGGSRSHGAALFEGGRVRIEHEAAGRGGVMMATGSLSASGATARKSEDIADLIDLFSKTQYRAKEVTPRVGQLLRNMPCIIICTV